MEKQQNFWKKDEIAIIIDSINKKNKLAEGLEYALTRLPDRTLSVLTTKFYDDARAGKYDGKINNSKFTKLREKQKNRIKLNTSIKLKADEVLVTSKNPAPPINEEPTPSLGEEPVENPSKENIHLEVKEEEQLSFIVQGTTSLGGIPLRAKFRITGTFTVDILPLEE